jgi:hypothetical protein
MSKIVRIVFFAILRSMEMGCSSAAVGLVIDWCLISNALRGNSDAIVFSNGGIG